MFSRKGRGGGKVSRGGYLFIYFPGGAGINSVPVRMCLCVCVSLSPVKGDPRGVRGGEAPSYMCYPGDAALGVIRMVGR